MLRRPPSRIELKLEDKAEYEEYRKRRKKFKRKKRKERGDQGMNESMASSVGDQSMEVSEDASQDSSLDGLTPPGPRAARARADRIGLRK